MQSSITQTGVNVDLLPEFYARQTNSTLSDAFYFDYLVVVDKSNLSPSIVLTFATKKKNPVSAVPIICFTNLRSKI